MAAEKNDPDARLPLEEAAARADLIRSIADLRERRGLTQTELAELAGTTQSAVSEFEKGVVEPRLATVQRFVAALAARLEMQLWHGPLLLLNSWDHKSKPFSEWTLRSVAYREALSAVSIKHGLARIWLQPSARLPDRRLPTVPTDPADETRNYLHHVVAQVAVSVIRPVFQDNRESNAGKLHESEMADPSYRRAFDDASSRRRLIDFLAESRAHRGMSQTRLARATGMSQSAISEFEKGVSEPRIASVQRWARAFGLRFELQLWEGPFVLFDSWIGRNLLYDSVVASVALNDQMANEWCEYWRRAQDSEPDAGSPIAVGQTIVEPTSQDPSTRGRYLRELVSALSTEVK